MVKNQLLWTRRSQLDMTALYKYVCEDSMQIALKIVNDIVAATEKAISNPEFYNPDKFKIDNDGSYRAFEKHRFRIAYRYQNNIIRVLRVRHTKMEPRNY